MNRDKLQKTKLLVGKDGVTSQIVDYYNRFGRDRDLEQYLTFSNPVTRHKCPSIHSETTSNFSTARCFIADDENHSDCLRKEKTQQHQMESDSDDSRVTKYQIKPLDPVSYIPDKQATSGNRPNISKAISIKFDSKTKLAIQDSDVKSDESSQGVISEPKDDAHQNLDSSLNKVGSPTSSITSRRLEWDSMADVGYANVGQNEHPHQNLSTLERMALDGHLKSGNSTRRKSASREISSQAPNLSHVGLPDAQSTPISATQVKSPHVLVKRKSILRRSPHRDSSSDRKCERKASSKERQEKSRASSSNPNNFKIDLTKHFSINVDINQKVNDQKKWLSDGGIRYDQVERMPLQDNNNKGCRLIEEGVALHKQTTDKFDSSDPKTSKVLEDMPTSEKEIQTSSRQNVSTSAQTSTRLMKSQQENEYQLLPNILTKGPVILNVVRSGSRPVYRIKKKKSFSQPTIVAPSNVTHESTESEDINEPDNASQLPDEQDNSPLKCGESLLSRAESFEYMPGHMYQNISPPVSNDVAAAKLPESGHPSMSSSSGAHSGDKEEEDFFNFETSSCFNRDLNAGVNWIRKLLAVRKNDPSLKKKLVQRVIEVLVKTDYPSEGSSDSRRHSAHSSKYSSTEDDKVEHVPIVEKTVEKIQSIKFDETDILLKRTAYYKQIFIKSQSAERIETTDKLAPDISPKFVHSAPALLYAGSEFNNRYILPPDGTRGKETCDKSAQQSISSNSSARKSSSKNPSRIDNIVVGPPLPVQLKTSLSELTKSKSDLIFEQYLIEKKREDIEKRQTAKRWSLIREMQHKKQPNENYTPTSLIDSTSSSDSVIETYRQLIKINNEIEQLNLLKLKLQNKRKEKGSGDDELKDVPLSSDLKMSPSKILPEKVQMIDCYGVTESTKRSNRRNDKPNVHIPLLNLKKSSDESSMNTLSNAEELSLESSSNNRDTKTIPPPTENPIDLQFGKPEKTIKTSQEIKNKKDYLFEKQFGILCTCCRSNLLASGSSSESDKNSAGGKNESSNDELLKLEKIYNKYQKCKVMKSFMKDYDSLVLKYQKKKEKTTKSVCTCTSEDKQIEEKESTHDNMRNIGHLHLIKLNERLKKFNEGVAEDEFKIRLIADADDHSDGHPKSAPLLGANLPLQKEKETIVRSLAKICTCTPQSQVINDTKRNVIEMPKLNRESIKSSVIGVDLGEDIVHKTKPCTCTPRSQVVSDTKRSIIEMPKINRESIKSSLMGVDFGEDIVHKTKPCTCTPRSQVVNDTKSIIEMPKINRDSIKSSFVRVDFGEDIIHKTKPCTCTPRSQVVNDIKRSVLEMPKLNRESMKSSLTGADLCKDIVHRTKLTDATTSPMTVPSGKSVLSLKQNIAESVLRDINPSDDFVLKVTQDYEELAEKVNRLLAAVDLQKRNNRRNQLNTKSNDENLRDVFKKKSHEKSTDPLTDDKIITKASRKSKKHAHQSVSVYNTENTVKGSKAEKKQYKAKDASKFEKSVCQCPKPSVLPMDSHLCSCCKRIERQKHISRMIREVKKNYIISKPIAYNLILKPSDSILDETVVEMKRQSLKDVIVKVPKHPGRRINDVKHFKQSIRSSKFISKSSEIEYNEGEEKGSTDEQIKEFSSLNEEYSDTSSVTDYPTDRSAIVFDHPSSEREKPAKEKSLTVNEYLCINRPQFVHDADKRRECLRMLHILRERKDAQRRRVLSLGVANLPNIKDISTSDLHQLADQYGITFSDTGKNRIFNTHDMVRNTTRQYKKLPEVQNKKLDLKKQQTKKTNFLMADLFAKKLREKALKGIVNISHSSNVVTI